MDKKQLLAVLENFGEAEAIAEVIHASLPLREPLPGKRLSKRATVFADVGSNAFTIEVEVGFYPDGRPGEVFIQVGKAGTMVRDMFDGFAIVLSIALQHGIPLSAYPVRGRGNELTGDGNALMDMIFEALEGLCITQSPITSPTESASSTPSTELPSASESPSKP